MENFKLELLTRPVGNPEDWKHGYRFRKITKLGRKQI